MFGALFDDGIETATSVKASSSSNASYHAAPAAARSASGFVGLDNQGATCYMNSLLQTWYMTPEIRQALYRLDPESILNVKHMKATDAEIKQLKSRARPRKVPLHLQKLFTELQCSSKQSISTSALTTEGFGWKDGDAQIQHDLDALYLALVDAVNQSLVKTDSEKLTSRLLTVRTSHSTETNTEPVYVSKRDDQGFSLQIPTIKNIPNLTTALSDYFHREPLDEGNPIYRIDKDSDHPLADQKVSADRVTALEALSPILLVSVNRMHFDMQTFKTSKLKDRFDCPLVLDMRPYFTGSTVAKETTKETKQGTKETKNPTPKKPAWGGAGQKSSSSSSPSTSSSSSSPLPFSIKTPSVNVWPDDLNTAEGEARAMSASESVKNEEYVYDLFAVVLHHGNSANSGHYTSYIRDTLHEGKWTPPKYKANAQQQSQNNKRKSTLICEDCCFACGAIAFGSDSPLPPPSLLHTLYSLLFIFLLNWQATAHLVLRWKNNVILLIHR